MAERSGDGAVHAIRDGIARAAAAPAVLAGTLALILVFSGDYAVSPATAILQYGAILALLPVGGLHETQPMLWPVVWSFLAGGILDRYARSRPTRGRGFFGACGAHFPAMLRLAVAESLAWLGIARINPSGNARYAITTLTLATGFVFLYARVRLVVEDRRSAIGALLASLRFIRRNLASALVFLIFSALVWIAEWLWLRPQTGVGLESHLNYEAWTALQFAESELFIALLLFLAFASAASAISLFQARLAHASYTAAPPIEWPESPAAEGITNLARSVNP